MDVEERLKELLDAAEQCMILIRWTDLGGEGGGLCTIRGERTLFVDTAADLETRYQRALSDLAQVPELDGCYLRPETREALERLRERAD